MCRRGEDIILITLNHLDTIRKLIGSSEHHLDLIDSAIKTLTEVSHDSSLPVQIPVRTK